MVDWRSTLREVLATHPNFKPANLTPEELELRLDAFRVLGAPSDRDIERVLEEIEAIKKFKA